MKAHRILAHFFLYVLFRQMIFVTLMLFRPFINLITFTIGKFLVAGSILSILVCIFDSEAGHMLGNRFNTITMFVIVFALSILLMRAIEVYDKIILLFAPDGWLVYFKYY